MSPPIRACEELEGRPARQVMRFQAMAPISAVMIIESATPAADAAVAARALGGLLGVADLTYGHAPAAEQVDDSEETREEQQRPEEVEDGGAGNGDARRQRPRPDGRRDGVRRIVEAVGEVEGEGDGDGEDQEE